MSVARPPARFEDDLDRGPAVDQDVVDPYPEHIIQADLEEIARAEAVAGPGVIDPDGVVCPDCGEVVDVDEIDDHRERVHAGGDR